MRMLNSSTVVLLGVGILSGCGGGDGGGDNGSSVRKSTAINASNGQRIAIEVVQISAAIANQSSTIVFVAPASGRNNPPGLRGLTYDLALERLAAGIAVNGSVIAQAQTQACPGGGTRTIDVSDKNNSGQLDVGDSAKITYNNCAQDGEVANGTIAFDVLALQGNPDATSTDWAFSFSFQFDDFSLRANGQDLTVGGGYIVNASYRASNAVYRVTTNGSELKFSEGKNTAQLIDFNFLDILASVAAQRTNQYDFTYDSSDFAGSVTVVTNIPFRRVQNYPPDSGSLIIRGANNTRVVVQATGGGTARISIDANGDSDFTDSQDRVINGQWTTLFG